MELLKASARGLLLAVFVQQVGHGSQLFSGSLQGLNLFRQLGLLSLLLAQHFMYVSHVRPPLALYGAARGMVNCALDFAITPVTS
jgi:hypothetical protein